MAIINDIGTLIARDPDGCPILTGTDASVNAIVIRYKRGLTPEEITDQFGHLSLAQVYAALAYYHANREEIETDLAEEENLYDRLADEHERLARASSCDADLLGEAADEGLRRGRAGGEPSLGGRG
ncbi:MAG TPA: DUF433 domain-containing protein [Thermoanaerobaculia bacterium]|jgi:uncharacterized protein (DUF433 family)